MLLFLKISLRMRIFLLKQRRLQSLRWWWEKNNFLTFFFFRRWFYITQRTRYFSKTVKIVKRHLKNVLQVNPSTILKNEVPSKYHSIESGLNDKNSRNPNPISSSNPNVQSLIKRRRKITQRVLTAIVSNRRLARCITIYFEVLHGYKRFFCIRNTARTNSSYYGILPS